MKLLLGLIASLLLSGSAWAQGPAGPTDISPLSGEVISIGSGSGNEVFSRWAATFMERHPGTTIQAIGSGSGSAFPALVEGRSDIAPMSRPMTQGMIDEFTKRRGYPPMVFDIGIGGVVVFVHPSNPIVGLTRAQLDGIYSHTYYISPTAILTWGDAGLSGEWVARPITLYATPEESGAWGLMRSEAATLSGRMKPTVVQLASADAVAAAVAADPSGIGFAPAGLRDHRVRVVPVASDAGRGYVGQQSTLQASRLATEFVAPDAASLASESYPLTRYFRLYVDQDPTQAMPAVLTEFLRYILSREAQGEMARAGYLPLPTAMAEEQAARLYRSYRD